MIARLRGELLDKRQDTITLDVQGVGYEVYTAPRVSAMLPDLGQEVSLVIYTDVRETAIVLYGFSTFLERQTFLMLKKVKGIGSRLAMSILSFLEPERLLLAIGKADTSALIKVPGVGKKSAERIIVELREQVIEFVNDSSIPQNNDFKGNDIGSLSGSIEHYSLSTPEDDASMALEKLGFSEDKARKAVKAALLDKPSMVRDAGELVKAALSYV